MEKLEKLLNESVKEDDAFISIKKQGKKIHITARGKNSAILIALAFLESDLLEEARISEGTF
jgi:hypothetical protein|nr:MAG TPA: hypothetical protein [Caudoviricetes sp.]